MVALSVNPMEAVDGARQTVKAAYPMLADPDHRVAEAYGVYNLLGDNAAAPAVFVIDTDGSIVWSYVGSSAGDRAHAPVILDHLP